MTWERGDRVAWQSLDRDGNRRAWTCAHRVFDSGQTYCSRVVPDHAVPPHPKQVRGSCSRCERMYRRSAAYLKERVKEVAA